MKIYILSLFVLLVVLALHFGGQFGLYNRFQFFDTIPHFLAGLGAGLFICEYIRGRMLSSHKKDLTVIGFVFWVAFVWEIFEYVTNTSGYRLGSVLYFADTIKDICMGLLGSMLAIWISRSVYKGRAHIK